MISYTDSNHGEGGDERPDSRERMISQIPAVELLMKLGYRYLSPAEANERRKNRRSQVVLTSVLREQLPKLNRISYRGHEYPFDETAIDGAVAALTNLPYESLLLTSEKIYDLLSLGKSFLQTVEGDRRSFDLRYIDWENPEANVFHVTEEFAVERAGSREVYRPDIVVFVNGIPLGVIECKPPGEREKGIVQHLRNQHEDGITKLYQFAQILGAIDKEGGQYATIRTKKEFWSVWKETFDETELDHLVNAHLPDEERAKLFWRREDSARLREDPGRRLVTGQDRCLYALFRPDRLLDLTRRFIVYDGGEKKIARYQQFRAVKSALERAHERDEQNHRRGGIVWHTQGSGKSLTMVMLGKSLALDPEIPNPRLILVTDRVELDKQICDTFHYCGYDPVRARDGRDLRRLIETRQGSVITTVIHKFERAVRGLKNLDDDENLFVLVDEGHRTNFGAFHATMRKALPRACYIGFTGTPVMKSDRSSVRVFGDFIDKYTIDEAVEDEAVVRLLYEGRHIEQDVDQKTLDRWFERLMRGKTARENADFKRKFGNADHVNRAEQRLQAVAWDVSEHFAARFQGTGAKGQLVAPRKEVALRYKELLDEIGTVTSEVLISGPDTRDDDEDCDKSGEAKVQAFWKEMMDRFRTEERYNESLINQFKGRGSPEIIIVVSKLLTGFDAPNNTVLYLDKKLSGHTLLQAIARVNRRHPEKRFGYIIDYYGVLGDLNRALSSYEALAEFEEDDLCRSLTPIEEEIRNLPQAHADLWAVFAEVKNRKDDEEFARCLAYEDRRDLFYERLGRFSRLFELAISSMRFLERTPEITVTRYRDDLRYFRKLQARIRQRYSEAVEYGQYERRVQELIDRYVGAGEVTQVTKLVDIFDKEKFDAEVEQLEGKASRADTIAHRTARTIREKWDEDPAFYRKFSQILKNVIEEFRKRRITDAEYLERVRDVLNTVRNRSEDHIPASLKHREEARAFYGHALETLGENKEIPPGDKAEWCADIGLEVDEIITSNLVVDWTDKPEIKNKMRNEIEDFLLDFGAARGIEFGFESIDLFLDQVIPTAEVRYR